MIKPLFASVLLLFGAAVLSAQDVALMEVRLPKSKETRRVALEFYDGDAPVTVENFKKLARKGFYNGLAFHRAFPHSLVQVGDPYSAKRDRSRVGTGGPGYTLPPEIRRKHGPGAVAMARLPDKLNPARVSSGSQFFVCLKPMPEYDGQYTVFAHVLYGLETLDPISALPVDSNDNPVDRVTIRKLRILPIQELPQAPDPAAKPAAPKRAWWKLF